MIKNTYIRVGSNILTSAIGILPIILIIRIFGVSTWGKVVYYYSVAGLYTIFADFGFSQAYSKFLAADDKPEDISTFLFFKFLFTIFTLAIFFGAYFFKFRHSDFDVALLFSVFGVLLAELAAQFFTLTFVGRRDFVYYSVVEILASLLVFVYVLFVCFVMPNIYMLAVSKAILPLVTVVGGLIYFRRNGLSYFLPLRLSDIRRYFSYAFPIAFSSVLGRFLSYFDKVALGSLLGVSEVGIYQIALRCYAFFDKLIKPVTNTMFTEIAHRISNVPDFFHKKFQDLLQVLNFFGGLLAICLVFGSSFVVVGIFGIENIRAAFILKFLVFSIVSRLFWRPYSHVIYSIEKHRLIALIEPFGAVVMISLYYLLIPLDISGIKFGAAALPISEFTAWLLPAGFLRIIVLKRHFGVIGLRSLLVRIYCPLAFIFVVGYFLDYSVIALLPALAVFTAVEIYLGILTKARWIELTKPFCKVFSR